MGKRVQRQEHEGQLATPLLLQELPTCLDLEPLILRMDSTTTMLLATPESVSTRIISSTGSLVHLPYWTFAP